jgi:hypothetical protein
MAKEKGQLMEQWTVTEVEPGRTMLADWAGNVSLDDL